MSEDRRSSDFYKSRQRELVEVVQNRGEIDRTGEYIAENGVDHTAFPGLPPGAEGAKQIFGMIRAGFPDHDAVVHHMIAEGDLVATYKSFTGTHTGEFMGIPPTGKRATIRVMDFVRYDGDKVVEHWNIVDQHGLMQQLGVLPAA
jgi:predicted ester cyclase